MTEIQGIYIISSVGKSFYIREDYFPNSDETYHALLTNFIEAFQLFALDLSGDSIKVIELEKFKLITTIEEQSGFKIVLKFNKSEKEKEIKKILELMKAIFLEIFNGQLDDESAIIRLKLKFDSEITNLLKRYDNISEFLKSL